MLWFSLVCTDSRNDIPRAWGFPYLSSTYEIFVYKNTWQEVEDDLSIIYTGMTMFELCCWVLWWMVGRNIAPGWRIFMLMIRYLLKTVLHRRIR